MRILITVDDSEDRTRIVHLLQDDFAGAALIAVADQDAYQQALADDPFDLVLTDHTLSWTDGLALLPELQARMPGVPVIMVSGANDERIAVQGMKAGLSDYIPKAHLEQLPAAVSAVLNSSPSGGAAGNTAACDRLLDDLHAQVRDLHAALDSIADAVIIYGPDGDIRRTNAAARQLAQYPGWGSPHSLDDPLTSWKVSDPVGGIDSPPDLLVARALQGETVRAELLAIQRGAHKEPAWVTLTVAPILSPSGEPHGAVATLTDVNALLETQHQLEDANVMLEEQTVELEEQTEEIRSQSDELRVISDRLATERIRLQAILDALPIAVFITDSEGRLIELNHHAREIWGLHAELTTCAALYANRTGWWTDSGAAVRPDEWAMVRALRHGEICTGEMADIERFDGTRGTILNSAAPIYDHEKRLLGGVSVSSDITPMLRIQHELEEANAMLEEQAVELEEQTEEIRSQNEELRVTSARLDVERARLQAILGALPVAVHIADANGRWVELNDQAQAIWGLQREVANDSQHHANRSGWRVDTGEPLQAGEWAMDRALRHGEISKAEMVGIERWDGTTGTILNSAAPIYDTAGRISGAVSVSQDITEHRALQNALDAERELLRIIYDTVPVMFAIYDPRIEQVVLNKHLERVTGWTAADTAATNVMELVYPDPAYRAEVAEFMQSLQPGFKDLQMAAKDGEIIESSWANVRLPDRRQVGIGLDISDRKRAEAALAQYAEELELLNQTNQMLLREVNHRVKNNLTAILGLIYAEKRRLTSHRAPEASAPQNPLSAILDDLAQRVGSLATVHTLLSASGWRPLRIDNLAGQVIEAAAPAAYGVQRLVINVEPSTVHVTADQAHHVALVIGELVTNSVKYGCCGEELHISLQSEQADGHVRLVYRDRGAGYPAEVLAGHTRSVGLGLLNTIVDISLRGAWSIRNDNGAVTELRFPHSGNEA